MTQIRVFIVLFIIDAGAESVKHIRGRTLRPAHRHSDQTGLLYITSRVSTRRTDRYTDTIAATDKMS